MKHLHTIALYLPRVLGIVYALFLGLMTYVGFDQVRAAWGFREVGLFMLIGLVSAFVVTGATWDVHKHFRRTMNKRNEEADGD